MKIRKMISAFCLAAGLALSVPALTSTLGLTQDMTIVQAASGWQTDSTGRYYLQNDQKVTGAVRIGEAAYYFNAAGYLVTGRTGLVQFTSDPDSYYYFNAGGDGTLTTYTWVNVNGQYYYADANGRIAFGTITVNGNLYHVTKTGRMTSYGKSSYDGKYYYAGSSGILRTGIRTINKKKYYFDPTTGARMTGQVQIGDDTYYFSAKTGARKTGWVKVKGKYYYYDSKGKLVTGAQTINGKKYYLNPKKGGARATSQWCRINKRYYFYNAKGVLQTGFISVNSKTYYASPSTGARVTGLQTINNRKYYFRKKSGTMKTGWVTYKNEKYYMNPSKSSSTYGAAKTGWVKIKGSWYYFNQDGTMRTGWLLDNMKYYYLDKSTGKMLTGRQTINGVTYNFGTSGGFTAEVSGSYSIQVNRKRCFVVVYKGSTAVKAFVCSTAADGVSTPTGTFTIQDKLRWHELNGPSWGQYCSHITSDILFHSVPCSNYNDSNSLKAYAYNQLGTPASGGCIRLTVKHAKWLYDNVPVGTKVTISDSVAAPSNVEIETAPKIPLTQTYDPTDPAYS